MTEKNLGCMTTGKRIDQIPGRQPERRGKISACLIPIIRSVQNRQFQNDDKQNQHQGHKHRYYSGTFIQPFQICAHRGFAPADNSEYRFARCSPCNSQLYLSSTSFLARQAISAALRGSASSCKQAAAKACGVSATSRCSPEATSRPSHPLDVVTTGSPDAIASSILILVPAPWRRGTASSAACWKNGNTSGTFSCRTTPVCFRYSSRRQNSRPTRSTVAVVSCCRREGKISSRKKRTESRFGA